MTTQIPITYKATLNIAMILASILTLSACNIDKPPKPAEFDKPVPAGIAVKYNIILKSNYDDYGSSTKSEAYSRVFYDSKTFQQEFAKFSKEIPPDIDFNKQRVIMDSAGLLSSGTTALDVYKVYDDGQYIHVIFEHKNRGGNCPVNAALNKPHIFISIDTTRPIKVDTHTTTESCS